MYFPRETKELISLNVNRFDLGLFLLGFSAGVFFVMVFLIALGKYKKRKSRKNQGAGLREFKKKEVDISRKRKSKK
jgi:hypothetical protein